MTAAAVSAAASDCGCAQVQGHSPLLRGAWVLLVLVLRARVSFSLLSPPSTQLYQSAEPPR